MIGGRLSNLAHAALRRGGKAGEAAIGRLDARAGIAPGAREDGAATVEFTLIFPIFIFMFMATFESSMMLFRQVMLERGVDVATRSVRLDGRIIKGRNELIREICEEAGFLPKCTDKLTVEMQVVNPNFDMPSTIQPCVNRLTSTALHTVPWPTAPSGQTMILRACYAVHPFMPTAGLATQLVSTLDGQSLHMVAATAFKIEPP